MSGTFRRTGLTRLSDDELMLFDVLFDSRDTLDSLRRENFREWHNLPYAHALGDEALEQTLQQLRTAGLVRRRTGRTPTSGRQLTWFALTPRGGALWMRERRPDWARYCADASSPVPNTDRWQLSVRSPSLKTARAFLAATTACGLYDADPHSAVVRRRERCRLLPWRVFPTVFELRVALLVPSGAACEWGEYERRRVWWRTIGELDGPPIA